MYGEKSESGGDARFAFGISEMQGLRPSMEDTHVAVLDLDEGKELSNVFFAVYDGHGDSTTAEYAKINLHKRLVEEESYKQGQYDLALKRAFLDTDEDLSKAKILPTYVERSGCTAIAALVTTDGKIFVANAGDSRSVISVKGEGEPLSFDHKPTDPIEEARIYAAGGYIRDRRVNNSLSLSRALGDFDFKRSPDLGPEEQIITANPDVTVHKISEDDEFFVIACDGIWDCLSSQEVVDIVRRQVAQGKELEKICENICTHCLSPQDYYRQGSDNMTIMIIAILRGRTKEDWYEWIKDRVNNNYGWSTPSRLPKVYRSTSWD